MSKKSKNGLNGTPINGQHSRVKKTARKKPAVKRTKASQAAPVSKPPQPSDEQIRVRAYYIAERRTHLSVSGDHHSDWLEAKRQLFEEAGLPLG